jgi:hypothetical protein
MRVQEQVLAAVLSLLVLMLMREWTGWKMRRESRKRGRIVF